MIAVPFARTILPMRLPAILGRCVALLTLLSPALACARVGEVLFVYGSAWAQSAGGAQAELRKGAAVEEGDRVTTGSNGRLQIRMDDGALVILRPSSELVIEQYRYSAAARTGSATTQTPRSLMSLVRGGLRAITGTLGKANPDAYEMQTAVATIGIRGTDYSAFYCADDCGDADLAPGLYVGVAEGVVYVRNAAGSLDVGPGQRAFVQDAQSAPVASQAAGRALALANDTADAKQADAAPLSTEAGHALLDDGARVVETPQTPETATVAEDDSGGSVDLVSGGLGGVPLAYAGGAQPGFSAVTATGASGALRNGHGDVIAFSGDTPAGAGRMEHAGGVTLDAGRDGEHADGTGLQWGRWSGGSLETTVEGVTQTRTLEGESVHWIVAATGAQPELPVTGRAEFRLIGNTNPTDDAGHVGTLGSASLSADFTARTVDADLSLSFSELAQVWKASAREVPLNESLATFGGAFDEVTVSGGGLLHEGTGSLSGFFTGQGHTLAGAGLSYGLTDGVANISGTAAFQRIETGP
jgi:hypothetical protein